MKLKILTGLSGPRMNLTRGDERVFEEAEAIRLVRAGYATPTNEDDAKMMDDAIAALEKEEAAAAKKAAEAVAKKKAKG